MELVALMVCTRQNTIFAAMQAVKKLETALQLDDSKPETLWCLGNAYTSEARPSHCLDATPLHILLRYLQALISHSDCCCHTLALHASDQNLISQGFLVASPQMAKDFFKKASGCFENASELVRYSIHCIGCFRLRLPLMCTAMPACRCVCYYSSTQTALQGF